MVRSGLVRSHMGTGHRRKAVDDRPDEKALTTGHQGGVGPQDQRGRVPTHRHHHQLLMGVIHVSSV